MLAPPLPISLALIVFRGPKRATVWQHSSNSVPLFLSEPPLRVIPQKVTIRVEYLVQSIFCEAEIMPDEFLEWDPRPSD